MMSSKWLSEFNFEEIGKKQSPTPWIPKKKANVSGVHDIDEQLEKKKEA